MTKLLLTLLLIVLASCAYGYDMPNFDYTIPTYEVPVIEIPNVSPPNITIPDLGLQNFSPEVNISFNMTRPNEILDGEQTAQQDPVERAQPDQIILENDTPARETNQAPVAYEPQKQGFFARMREWFRNLFRR